MSWDPDDLPAGYPDMWSPLVDALRVHGVQQGRTDQTRVGVSRRDDLTDADVVEARRRAQRGYEHAHYARAKRDPAWLAKRNARRRELYAAAKAVGR